MGKRSWRTAALAVAGVVVAGGGAGTAYAAMSSSGPAYRLATVTSADETASLLEVGTLSPVQQADVAFSVSGTVQSVSVQAGQYVTAGQALGSLDTTSLKASLATAQSALAQANLQVDNDTASQDNAADTTGAGSAGTPAASQPAPSLGPLQQAVLSAQRQVDSALAQAKTALAQARQACAAAPSPSPSPAPSPSPSSSPSPTAAPSSPGPTPAPSADPGTCVGATQRALDAETAVLQAQQALSGRLTALSNALSADAGSSSGGGGSGGSGQAGGSGPPGGSGSSGGSAPVSAAQLAADQASADAAAAQVTVAEQDLAAATVVSPISGTVTEVSVTPGASATAGSTAFEIAGLNSFQVLTSVPVTDMPELKVGERASVQPDGVSTPVSGSVVSIGLMPDTSESPPTYPVTIGLTGQPSGLHSGGYASVTIVTARGSGVSVPTSAVHYSGNKATVTVYAGGKARVTKVKVGTRGPVMTQISSGLRIGQEVVLANLNAPLPSNNPNNQGPGPIIFGGPGGAVGTVVGPGGPGG